MGPSYEFSSPFQSWSLHRSSFLCRARLGYSGCVARPRATLRVEGGMEFDWRFPLAGERLLTHVRFPVLLRGQFELINPFDAS